MASLWNMNRIITSTVLYVTYERKVERATTDQGSHVRI